MSRSTIHAKEQIRSNTLDLGRLELDFLKSQDWNINDGNTVDPGTITGIPDPVNDLDVVNKRYLQTFSAQASGVIGAAEDGQYVDGIFTDFVPTTPIGTAVDRFNEILGALAPSPAPNLVNATSATAGVSGKLSFDPSHSIPGLTSHPSALINSSYSPAGDVRGIINAATAVTATLAQNVVPNYTNDRPHPNYAFGDGDKGTLHLEVNGTVVHSVDLTTFASGASVNANGSGFNLTAATAVKFDKGTFLDLFKYRTGTVNVAAASMRPGYNSVRVRHEYATGLYRDTNVTSWIVDNDATATAFNTGALSALSATGSKYLSGVRYHTGATASYAITISNAYKNTYSASASAISFNGTNCTAAAQSMPAANAYTDDVILTGKTVTVNNSRLYNVGFSLTTSVLRTVQSTLTSGSASITGLLLDSVVDDANATTETFNGEGFRIHGGISLTDTSYGAGGMGASSYTWDSAQNLLTGNANHVSGLLVSFGELTYPKATSHIGTITNGDFSAAANGYGSNPNYSTASGNRTYLRYFYDAASRSNFRLNVTATGTTFVPVATGASGANVTLEVLAPNTTKNAGGTVVWKDACVAHSGNDTDLGCYASTFGNSRPTNWGLTLGSKNTSTSGKVIVVRITASPTWTGKISNIALTWL